MTVAAQTDELEFGVERIARARRKKLFTRYALYFLLAVLVAWSLHAIVILDTDWDRISVASVMKSLVQFVVIDFSIIPGLIGPAIETICMATLASVFGAILSLPVAWLAAMNITPLGKLSYGFGRLLITLSRSVHEIVWGLIFVAAVGLGPLAGILAMAARSIGFISKTIAEAIEDVDNGPVEALRAAGANKFQILVFAIVPQVLPVMLGNIIFEWDVNIRRSTIMGLVGAGGLGLSLFRQMAAYNYGGVSAVILVVLFLIIIGELVSYYARKSVI